MNKKLLSLILFFLFLPLNISLLGFSLNSFVAAELNTPLPGLEKMTDLPSLVQYVFTNAINVAIALAVLVIIFGGLYHLFSLGSGKMTSEGKEWVKAGITGLLIILSAVVILKTVNPDIVDIKIRNGFPGIFLTGWGITGPGGSNIPNLTYTEYPVGSIIETLLSRTVDCFDFDENGNPIDGNPKTANDIEPSLKNHDRVDCFFKLSSAAKRKAEITDELSDEIIKLMNSCSCAPNCDNSNCECSFPGPPLIDGSCPENPWVGTEAPCQTNCNQVGCRGEQDCCPEGVKDKIEHGDIVISACEGGQPKAFQGLDEFRTELYSIIPVVEEDRVIDERPVKIIIKEDWGNLRLVEQIMYLKEKINAIRETFGGDLKNLYDVEGALSSCYFKRTSVDLMKIIDRTDKKEVAISINKPFDNPVSSRAIDSSKYCKGYFYSDSEGLAFCQKSCNPGLNNNSYMALKNDCDTDDTECLQSAFYLCEESSDFKTFIHLGGEGNDCLSDWKSQCEKDCSIYAGDCASTVAAYDDCLMACKEDSKNLSDHLGSCYFNPEDFKTCADDYNTFEDYLKCAEASFKCRFCSDQYAGDPSCLKEPVQTSEQSSSFYLYNNPDRQKCSTAQDLNQNPECIKCPTYSTCPFCPCDNTKTTNGKITTCSNFDQSRLICKAECGEYAYNQDPLTFYCETDTDSQKVKLSREIDSATGIEVGVGFWSFMTDSSVDRLSLGINWRCPLNNEKPVGKTTDNSEQWAKSIMDEINNIADKVDGVLDYIKKIGNEKDYCKCDSTCGNDEKTCKSSCIFYQSDVKSVDENGNEYSQCAQGCNRTNCQGNPCQKILNMLIGKNADESCPKGVEYKGVAWYVKELSDAVENLSSGDINKGRSEELKRLSYSRKQMDSASVTRVLLPDTSKILDCSRVRDELMPPIFPYGKVFWQNNLLKSYCYGGRQVSAILKTQLMDNWFSCEKINK